MQSKILIEAIEKAIRSGATALPYTNGRDVEYVRAQTDVAIDAKVFETYIAELRADTDVAALEGLFANMPFGGGASVNLSQTARLLLAQAIATKDIRATVARFMSHMTTNSAPATVIMAVSGIKVAEPIQLGPTVMLTPLSALPPSTQRGAALGQGIVGFGPHIASQSALSTKLKFGPVYYKPKNPQPAEEVNAHISADQAHLLLEEAYDLLSVIGVHPYYQMSWVQPDDWLMAGGLSAGWQSSPSSTRSWQEVPVPKAEAEAIATAFFALDRAKRAKVLRIPLDRLARAGRERDLADKVIDLGIAVEALLLHDLGSDRGELSYRLSLRGAWLVGTNPGNRAEIQKALRDLYNLRSTVVHSGSIENNAKNKATIERGADICRDLVRKVIELECDVDWNAIVLGA